MKKILVFVLTILMLGLCACDRQVAQSTTTPATEVTEPRLRDPNMPEKLLRSDVTEFPLSTEETTYAERRQQCVDFMALQTTAQWKTNVDVEFQMTHYKRGMLKYLKTDEIYGGIFYHSLGFGNPYRWLEYYDEETGIMDLERAIAENGGIGPDAAMIDTQRNEAGEITYTKYCSLMALGNQCSSAICWSWGRMINSVSFGDTCDLNVYNGYIPVGGYTYGYEHEGKTYTDLELRKFGKKSETNPTGYDTDDVIRDWNMANGLDAMFACYAQMKPGDCLVNQGHTLMVKHVNLYLTKDGEVDYGGSTVTVLEQIENWNYEGFIGTTPYKQQGRNDQGYSFEELQKDGYIPFTFVELLDPDDEQDRKHLEYYRDYMGLTGGVKEMYSTFTLSEKDHGEGVEKAETYCTYTGDTITVKDFAAMTVGSNYSVSDVFVTVSDQTGKELLRNVWRAPFSNYREVSMTENLATWEEDTEGNLLPLYYGMDQLQGEAPVVKVQLQLSTGELLTAYEGKLN